VELSIGSLDLLLRADGEGERAGGLNGGVDGSVDLDVEAVSDKDGDLSGSGRVD
jgi:hypothetical protein